MDVTTLLAIAIGVIFIYAAISQLVHYSDKRRAKTKKVDYQKALASGNKEAALAAGRAYYGSMREHGELTAADEQAIANDLATM